MLAILVGGVARAAAKASPKAVFIIFANPMDVMCHVAIKGERVPGEQGNRAGGRAGQRALPDVDRLGSEGFGGGRHAQVLGGHTEGDDGADR